MVTGGTVGVTDLEIEEVIEVVIGEMEVDMVVGGTNKVRVRDKVRVKDREEVRERSSYHRMLSFQMHVHGLVWCYCTLCTLFINYYTALTVPYSLLHCAALDFIVVYGDDQAPWDEYEVR